VTALRVLIVDDEAFARQRLRRLLTEQPDVEVVGEAANGREAVSLITTHNPDVVLLDVQMPRVDGFGVLRALDGPAPLVIFVTAFDKYAIQAFEVNAVDYLLKPVTRERFSQALTRVRERLAQHGADNQHMLSLLQQLAAKKATVLAMDSVPRISRAQTMDVLSSQANIAGYKAVLVAAYEYGRFMPMLMTAAGTVKAARVLILGAGVAGLQAIATAKRLGAVIEAFDVRPAVREQVESLGAAFLDLGIIGEESEGGYARELSAAELERQQEEREAELARLRGVHVEAGWGNQIRSYVLQPYTMVKDLRTGVETSNPTAVLDGDLDAFIDGYLRSLIGTSDGDAA